MADIVGTAWLDLCNQALKATGTLGVGQTALAEDINDTFTNLRQMLAQWQKRRWLIPALEDIGIQGNNQPSFLVGTDPTADFQVQRPDKIQAAYVRINSQGTYSQFNTDFSLDFAVMNIASSIGVDYPLREIFSYEDYSRLALKHLNSFPYMFFYDAAYPLGNLFIWPIPSQSYEIRIVIKSYLPMPQNVNDPINVPPEYEEAIWANLAVRLCINYQVSASKELAVIAKVGLNTIRNANTQISTLKMPSQLGFGNSYNIFSDGAS